MTNGTGTKPTRGPVETVWITPGNPPMVNPDPVRLHVEKSPNNPKKIKWECTVKSAEFKVEFESGTPFDQPVYEHKYRESNKPGDDCVSSEPRVLNPGGDAGNTYKYSVSVNGGPPLDPEVIIER